MYLDRVNGRFNYYPINNADIDRLEVAEAIEIKIGLFDRLVESIDALYKNSGLPSPLSESELDEMTRHRDTLAFFVEANSQMSPESWQTEVDSFVDSTSTEPIADVTARLYDSITILYETALAQLQRKALDHGQGPMSERFGRDLKLFQAGSSMITFLKKRNLPIPFGVISQKYAPSWQNYDV